jgi:hypothetical protein
MGFSATGASRIGAAWFRHSAVRLCSARRFQKMRHFPKLWVTISSLHPARRLDDAVLDIDDAVGVLGDIVLVSDEDDGVALGVQTIRYNE